MSRRQREGFLFRFRQRWRGGGASSGSTQGGRRERKGPGWCTWGRECLAPQAEGVTHLTAISGCSFPHPRAASPAGLWWPGSHRDILPRASKGQRQRQQDADRDTNTPPKTGGCGCHLSLAATRKCIHMAPPRAPEFTCPGHPAPGSRWTQGAEAWASSLKPQTPSPSRQTAPERTRRGPWVHPQEAVPARAAGLVTSWGTFAPRPLPPQRGWQL